MESNHKSRCPCCNSPVITNINHDAPFTMFACGTREWHCAKKGLCRTPKCWENESTELYNKEIDAIQEKTRPTLPGE